MLLVPALVQQPINGCDSGILDIAFDACLVLGEAPSHANLHAPRMGPHLATSLKISKTGLFLSF